MTIYNAGKPVHRPVSKTALSGSRVGKDNYPHFMLKEICEQPVVIGNTLQAFLNPLRRRIKMPPLPFDFATVPRVTVVACGTASLAGMVAKY